MLDSCYRGGSNSRCSPERGIKLRLMPANGIARRRLLLVAVAALLIAPTTLLSAQQAPEGVAPYSRSRLPQVGNPTWEGELTAIGANALLGGLAASIIQIAQGEPFWPGFLCGAAGGGLMYGGKRLAAARFAGAGLLGRQISAIGASVVRNASQGQAPLSRLTLPLGIVRLYVERDSAARVYARADLAGLIATGYAIIDSNARFDLSSSLSAGAPVFFRDNTDGVRWRGMHGAGVIWVHDVEGSSPDHWETARILAQERVHVLQYDQSFIALAEPAERWLFRQLPAGTVLGRYLDLGLNFPVWGGLNLLIDYEDRPWEWEAYYLSQSPPEAGEPPPRIGPAYTQGDP